jgi:NAD dependent epimerase/dehydratase
VAEKVLVTGAGGFIGSHLVERLVERGYNVRALVHYNSSSYWSNLEEVAPKCLREVEVMPGDVTDSARVEEAVRGCDIVFHLAALISIPYSYSAVRSYLAANVSGTANVAEACLRAGVRRMVHTSTSEVYGSAQYVPIDEAHPLVAQSPYSASKIAGDKLVESFAKSFGLPVCTVRPFNTYGPRQSARAVIPTIVTQALSGDIVQLGSTTPVRDLTYVTDTADGFIAAGRASAGAGEVINLGTGEGLSVGQLVEEVARRLGKTLTVQTDPDRVRPTKSEVERLISNNGKAARLLGWRPQTSIAQGLDATTRYIEQHLARYKVGGYTL